MQLDTLVAVWRSDPGAAPIAWLRYSPMAVPECCSARRAAPRSTCDQSRSDALTGIIGARRACTVSMISPLSMPWR
jgi:hypothetical protein